MPTALPPGRYRAVRQITQRPEMGLWEVMAEDGRTRILKRMTTSWLALSLRGAFMHRLSVLQASPIPSMARVIGGWVRPRECVAIIDYLPRGSLYDALAPGERRLWTLPLVPREAVRLVSEAAEGVAALHVRHEMHGGLKLSNILLSMSAEGTVHALITDALLHLGLAGYGTSSWQRRPRGIADPLLYVASEQYQRRPGYASDQYALAVIAYILLTGESPYPGDPLAWLRNPDAAPFPPASAINPTLPTAVDDVLGQALRRQPRNRYRTLPEFVAALRQAVKAPEIARSMQIEMAREATAPPAAKPRPITQSIRAHEAVEPPRPLATLSQGAEPSPHGFPDLPPNYSWTDDALASMPLPVVTPTMISRRQQPQVAVSLLIGAVVVIMAVVIALLVVTLISMARIR